MRTVLWLIYEVLYLVILHNDENHDFRKQVDIIAGEIHLRQISFLTSTSHNG